MQRDIKSASTSEELIVQNDAVIANIRKLVDDISYKIGRSPTYEVNTIGCQMNEHDSEKIIAMLHEFGYVKAKEGEIPDFVLFNTCAVRENAEFKVYGNVGALKPFKEKKPSMKIAICGCMMQQEHVVDKIKRSYNHVDLIFGTHNLHNFPNLFLKMMSDGKMTIEVWEKSQLIVEGLPVKRESNFKALVNIMYGCNKFCSYCIVPYTRGRERSRNSNMILKEIEYLVNDGVKEITLLGQNVDSYGFDFKNGYHFAHLLRDIDAVIGNRNVRVRFMTPHPKDMLDDAIEAIAELKSVCEYIHLPIQAGSDALLKRMRRQYTVAEYLALVKRIKDRIPNVSLSTDIIIGFPGETEEDVDGIIEVIKEVQYDTAFTFIYSPRVGTPAARMPQIDEKIKHARFDRMLEVLNEGVIAKNMALTGQEFEVLVEGRSRFEGALMGRGRDNKLIHFNGDDSLLGEFARVRVTEPKKFSLYGELIND